MLSPETKLGPYEIVAPLGAGGMGEGEPTRRRPSRPAEAPAPPRLASPAPKPRWAREQSSRHLALAGWGRLSRLGGVRAARRNPERREGSDAEPRNKAWPVRNRRATWRWRDGGG